MLGQTVCLQWRYKRKGTVHLYIWRFQGLERDMWRMEGNWWEGERHVTSLWGQEYRKVTRMDYKSRPCIEQKRLMSWAVFRRNLNGSSLCIGKSHGRYQARNNNAQLQQKWQVRHYSLRPDAGASTLQGGCKHFWLIAVSGLICFRGLYTFFLNGGLGALVRKCCYTLTKWEGINKYNR